MTRFARAKGSKASNERVEEEATPWQLLKVPQESGSKKHFNVEDLDDDVDFFEDKVNEGEGNDSDDKVASQSEEEEEEKSNLLGKIAPQEELSKSKKRKRNQNKCLNCKEPGHLKKECPKLSEERRSELQDLYQMKIDRKGKGTGRKKKKRKLEEVLDDAENTKPKFENKSSADPKKAKKSKPSAKIIKDKTGQVVQEGEGLFQGFRVLQADVQKLRDLVTELEKRKASPAEMKKVLKKERRKAEKTLANVKKNVCYKCREPGHQLSQCPKISEKIGKCFKCGSDEHTSKDCISKLKGADAYKFADCFICKQKGHLAKSCPDNPKGLYPKGGGCRFCGSVEHLKSECPRKSVKDAKNYVTAKRHSDKDNIEEEVDLQVPKIKFSGKNKPKQSKVVNF